MISQKAKNSLASILIDSVKETLEKDGATDKWTVQELSDPGILSGKELSIITMCSYHMRLFATIHFRYDEPEIEHVIAASNHSKKSLTKTIFNDFFAEQCNQFCGNLKRKLIDFFPQLAISTPDHLSEQAFSHFKSLGYELDQYVCATAENKLSLFFGLYACAYGEIDFVYEKAENVATGELEFF